MLIIGYATLNSKCFKIYIHNAVAIAILIPEHANCQFSNTCLKYSTEKWNAPIRAPANFKNICDATKNKLCTVDSNINLSMTTIVEVNDLCFENDCKTKYVSHYFWFYPKVSCVTALVPVVNNKL